MPIEPEQMPLPAVGEPGPGWAEKARTAWEVLRTGHNSLESTLGTQVADLRDDVNGLQQNLAGQTSVRWHPSSGAVAFPTTDVREGDHFVKLSDA